MFYQAPQETCDTLADRNLLKNRNPSRAAQFLDVGRSLHTPGLENCGFGGKNKTQSFQKLFVGGHLFVFVEYLCKRSPKIKTKNIKNYSSILAIANHRNWLDDSPPLISSYCPCNPHGKAGNEERG